MPTCRILTEAYGAPIRPDDDRVPYLLLEGRPEAPAKSRDPLAVLEEKLTRLIEAGNRKASPRRRAVPLMEAAVTRFSEEAASAIVAAFARRFGPGPWRVRSVA
jgi:hypothetical protein